jgi:hypothetical protein
MRDMSDLVHTTSIAPPDEPCFECGRYGKVNSARYVDGRWIQMHHTCLEKVMRASRLALYHHMKAIGALGGFVPAEAADLNFFNRQERRAVARPALPTESAKQLA